MCVCGGGALSAWSGLADGSGAGACVCVCVCVCVVCVCVRSAVFDARASLTRRARQYKEAYTHWGHNHKTAGDAQAAETSYTAAIAINAVCAPPRVRAWPSPASRGPRRRHVPALHLRAFARHAVGDIAGCLEDSHMCAAPRWWWLCAWC